MTVRVALGVRQALHVLRGDVEGHALGDHRHAVAAAVGQPLEDRPDQRVDDRLQPDRRRKLLGNERRRRARGLADAEGQVTSLPAHRNHEVPPRCRLGVDHQVLDDVHAVVASRLEPERVDVGWQVEIVVDRLRHVDDANPPRGARLELHRRERRVVAADRHELRDVQPQQRVDGLVEERRVFRGIGTRDAEVRTAAEVNAADGIDRERDDVIDVALHDPRKPVADADDVDALEPGADGRCADDRIDAGGRAASDQDGESIGHDFCFQFLAARGSRLARRR